ncbi:C-C motif chemokine 28 isoform X1 [Hyaena hyaena]|uniref:C-C motif chemokine 28 isoform X1 n=1 Tax=Hyaena hyaena TaxID=95912 RepID=UPI001923FBD5|nr:C-C motif chemokine 28 isoform X1 [Hyaena hyaena]
MWLRFAATGTTRFSLPPLFPSSSSLGPGSGSSTKSPALTLLLRGRHDRRHVSATAVKRRDVALLLAAPPPYLWFCLHVRRRRLCVSPHSHVIKQWMKEQAAKKSAKGNLCHRKSQAGKGNSKGARHGKPETRGHQTPY